MGELFQFPANGHTATGYLALPAAGSGPGVLVLQEWWGLVDHIQGRLRALRAGGLCCPGARLLWW